MTAVVPNPSDVVRGPAVVVDDKIDDPAGALALILTQLDEAAIPVVRLRKLPSPESVVHWRQFGLIVLDWELTYSNLDDHVDTFGITVPPGLADDNDDRLTSFVRLLLAETMLPIFVASSGNTDRIRTYLDDKLADLGSGHRSRVRVYSKTALELSLFDEIEKSISSRPAVSVLRAWNRSYLNAELATFRHFIESDEDWVAAVLRAAVADTGVGEDALRETIARNIVNRIEPLEIKLEPASDTLMADASSLRTVMHLSAVVPGAALDNSDLASGDLFIKSDSPRPYEQILILITPDCDLVRIDPVRFLYLRANLYPDNQAQNSKNRVKRLTSRRPESLLTSLLTPTGNEYKIALKDWDAEWVAMPQSDTADKVSRNDVWPGYRRIGRLMDPYISNIQQSFAGEAIRKGLPRIPDDFFEGWTGP